MSVDGRTLAARAGETVLQLLRRSGIWVPTLCYDERVSAYGGCRLCVVSRRDGTGGLVPACDTEVVPGMVLETCSTEVLNARRRQLALLLSEHRLDCPVCPATGRCRLELLLHRIGVPGDQLPRRRVAVAPGVRSALIVADPERCVTCTLCVRLCEEVQGVAALGLERVGDAIRVATFAGRELDCEYCGQCVAACPAGALLVRQSFESVRRRYGGATTTCSFCPCGCQVEMYARDGRAVAADARLEGPPNRGLLCAKGRFGHDVLVSPERLTSPLLRREGRLVPVPWDEALRAVVEGARAAAAQGRALVAFGTPRLTCEDAFLLQDLLRRAMGSPHVGAGPAAGARALVEGLWPVLGTARSTADFEDLAMADLVLVLRADPTRTHPLVKTTLLAGMRRRGQRVVMAHALSGGLERHVTDFLAVRPLGEEALVLGLCRHLLAAPAPRMRAAAEAAAGWEAFATAVEAWSDEVVEGLSGIGRPRVAALARLLARARRVVVVLPCGLGVPGDEAAITRAAATLMVLLGRHGSPGCGVLVLGEKSNLQGCLDVGLHPRFLPGYRPAPNPGWDPVEAMSKAGEGVVGFLYLVGHDPLGGWPRATHRRDGLENAGFVVVQDAFLTKTTRAADVVLPVAILAEREGSVVGADGVRRRLQAAVPAPAGVAPDGEIFRELGRRWGTPLPTGEEVERILADLFASGFPAAAAPLLVPPPPPPPPRTWRGTLLDVSPQLWHSGSVTRYSAVLRELAPIAAVRLAPEDIAALGLTPGGRAHLITGTGEEMMVVRGDRTVRPGSAVVLWQSNAEGLGAFLAVDGEARLVDVRRCK